MKTYLIKKKIAVSGKTEKVSRSSELNQVLKLLKFIKIFSLITYHSSTSCESLIREPSGFQNVSRIKIISSSSSYSEVAFNQLSKVMKVLNLVRTLKDYI